ncbi:MAG: hypothetical protein SPF23_05095 [Paludibacteraceae bacterium]|nr:hypothetical protein [Bacteroidales bacterium]MDD6746608.1 hypothetical protein [Paludibacteraceae bacterium]MDY5651395.1 hypothetical protein [Paludibacteraceae bacterium]
MVHKALKLFRRQQHPEFIIYSLHALHVFSTGKTLLTITSIPKMHLINGVNTHGVLNIEFANKSSRLA